MHTNDFIRITGLEILAFHGVLEEEKKEGQKFYLNVNLYYGMEKAGRTDMLSDALNYADCCEYISRIFTEKRFDLIEAAAEYVCKRLLCHYEVLERVELELCKPSAPIELPFSDVSVNLAREWHRVYLAVGSNMGDRQSLIENGIRELAEDDGVRKVRASRLIETRPYGPVEQENFLNGCVELETFYEPQELLALLHEIEAHADRRRELHWGPRTLDLDIIFYDNIIYDSKNLVIPHIDMDNRRFVLAPLSELCPDMRHPVSGHTVAQMLAQVDDRVILFDMDGTLIDSSEGVTKSAQYALRHYGIEVSDLDTLKKFIGPPLSESFSKYYGFSKEQAVEAVGIYRQRYNTIGIFECCLYPGVESCIRELKKQGYRIGVASSKPEISCRRILDHFGILDLFDDVAGATMDGRIETKKQVLVEALGRWNQIPVEHMLLIGDTLFDVEGANQVGMRTIGVSFGFGDVSQMKEAGAVTICNHMLELSQIIAQVADFTKVV